VHGTVSLTRDAYNTWLKDRGLSDTIDEKTASMVFFSDFRPSASTLLVADSTAEHAAETATLVQRIGKAIGGEVSIILTTKNAVALNALLHLHSCVTRLVCLGHTWSNHLNTCQSYLQKHHCRHVIGPEAESLLTDLELKRVFWENLKQTL